MIDRRAFFVAGMWMALLPGRPMAAADPLSSGLDGETKARLLALAQQRGALSVIVGFTVPGLPGPDEELATSPGPADDAARQAAIKQVRERLLTDLGVQADDQGGLSGAGLQRIKLFTTIPFVAVTAEPEALARLMAHPLVSSMQVDDALPPR
jgi:hypothetical protein